MAESTFKQFQFQIGESLKALVESHHSQPSFQSDGSQHGIVTVVAGQRKFVAECQPTFTAGGCPWGDFDTRSLAQNAQNSQSFRNCGRRVEYLRMCHNPQEAHLDRWETPDSTTTVQGCLQPLLSDSVMLKVGTKRTDQDVVVE